MSVWTSGLLALPPLAPGRFAIHRQRPPVRDRHAAHREGDEKSRGHGERTIEVARSESVVTWRVDLAQLSDRIPLVQRYPSHLQRVLEPAHEMLVSAGLVRSAEFRQARRQWVVDYVLLHELAHLIEANHGRRFHALLADFPHTERAKGFLEGVSWRQR